MKIPSHPILECYQSKSNRIVNEYRFDQIFGYLEYKFVTYIVCIYCSKV